MANREYETRENHQNRSDEGKVGKNFLLGAFIGGVAGAVAGMLLAPKSGKELRNSINQQAGSLLDRSSQIRGEVVEKGNDLVQKAKDLKPSKFDKNNEEETPTNYISLKPEAENKTIPLAAKGSNDDEIQKKLEEAKRAFEEEENRISVQ